jgi:hypothetical protein
MFIPSYGLSLRTFLADFIQSLARQRGIKWDPFYLLLLDDLPPIDLSSLYIVQPCPFIIPYSGFSPLTDYVL